jgi:hypothetical protein
MKNRIKELYLDLGRILNSPKMFGLGERLPRALADELTRIQLELLEELREQGAEQDYLSQELSQDADRHAFPRVTSTSFVFRK